jgi:hypothetical protein
MYRNLKEMFSEHYMKRKFLKNKLWIIMILLFPWVLFQYKNLNRFYAVFLVFFVLGQLIFRKQYFILLVVAVLAMIFFKTSVVDTIQAVRDKSLYVVWNPREPLTNIFTPGSGEDVLPGRVQILLSLQREFELSSYNLSGQFLDDPLLYQRTMEAVWPIQYNPNSPYIFYLSEDSNPEVEKCQLRAKKEDVKLVYCD